MIDNLIEEATETLIKQQYGKLLNKGLHTEQVASNFLPRKVLDCIKSHRRASALSSLVPEVGMVGVFASVWHMYYSINEILGISFSETLVKSISTGIASNLVGFYSASFILDKIPFANILNAPIMYGATCVQGYVYIKVLSALNSTSETDVDKVISDVVRDNTSLIRQLISEFCGDGANSSSSEGCIFEKSYCQIGTLGHVDHGKTTLTAAITTVLAKNGFSEVKSFNQIDNAPLLKNHNVTMHAARVEYETESRRYSHVDCPNHSDYVRSLVTGTVHLDGAILVVSATDGPMPQTREHVLIARQLNVRRLVVFLNKCDLVEDDEMLDLVELEVQEILAQYEFEDDTPIIRGSALGALNGVTKWEQQVMELMDACDAWIPNSLPATNKPFLMPVEDVFEITGRGTVVTGCIESGVICVGDEVELIGLGEKKKSVVTGVEMFRKVLDMGEAGDNVGLLLRGLNQNDVIRGMVLCHPGQIKQSKKFKASMYACRPEENGRGTPFGNKYRPQFYFRTMDLTGEIYLPKGVKMVMPGDNVEIIVELIYPIPLEEGLNFSVHEGKYTVGFGVVTEVF